MKAIIIVVITLVLFFGCGESGSSGNNNQQSSLPNSSSSYSSSNSSSLSSSSASSIHSSQQSSSSSSAVVSYKINYEYSKSVPISYGSIWGIPVYDGSNIIISSEDDNEIYAAKFDSNLNILSKAVKIVSKTDMGSAIADHKHIFQNGYHYIVCSSQGDGSGGKLLLVKIDTDLNLVAKSVVTDNDAPTNDMLLAGDGTHIYIGKFVPGQGHIIYKYDNELNFIKKTLIGGGDDRHSNGAVLIYYANKLCLIAPDTLAPHQNSNYSRITFDENLQIITHKTTILTHQNSLSIVSAASIEPYSNNLIIHYANVSTNTDGGNIYRAIFDNDFKLLSDTSVRQGNWQRPHSLVLNDKLYLAYDSVPSVEASIFNITVNSNTVHSTSSSSSSSAITKTAWIKTAGATKDDTVYSATLDSDGNSYITGYFHDDVDFSNSSTALVSSNGKMDIFIAKYNHSGKLIWVKTFGGDDDDKGANIILDNNDNLYVTGDFRSSNISFGKNQSYHFSNKGEEDAFILKLDKNGNILHVDTFGSSGKDAGIAMAVDTHNNLLLTGFFAQSVDFNTDPNTENILTSSGSIDAFVLKLTPSAHLLWVKSFDGTDWVKGLSIISDSSNNIYTTGYFRDSVDFNPSTTAEKVLTAIGGRDFFITKLDTDGKLVWAGGIGSKGEDRALSMSIDNTDNKLYIAGFYSGICDFDISSKTSIVQPEGASDGFILKLDTDGKFEWVRNFGGIAQDKVRNIRRDSKGNIIAEGYFEQTAHFDKGNITATSQGEHDTFIIKLDKNGNYLDYTTIGGSGDIDGYALNINEKNYFIAGGFQGDIEFDSDRYSSDGENDIFLTSIPLL